MLQDDPRIAQALDSALIGFLTAVNQGGQPQTSPVWFIRDGDTLVVYNKADTPRLGSIASNSQMAFHLRGDSQGRGAVLLEGRAVAAPDLGPSYELTVYVEKYQEEMERIGWTPKTFHDDYPVPIRIEITRVRSWGLDVLGDELPAEHN